VCVTGDFNGWDVRSDPMLELAGSDVHWFELELPLDARVEYKFVCDGVWLLDSMNPDSVCGKFGCNSVLTMPEYAGLAPSQDVSSDQCEARQLSLRSKVLGATCTMQSSIP